MGRQTLRERRKQDRTKTQRDPRGAHRGPERSASPRGERRAAPRHPTGRSHPGPGHAGPRRRSTPSARHPTAPRQGAPWPRRTTHGGARGFGRGRGGARRGGLRAARARAAFIKRRGRWPGPRRSPATSRPDPAPRAHRAHATCAAPTLAASSAQVRTDAVPCPPGTPAYVVGPCILLCPRDGGGIEGKRLSRGPSASPHRPGHLSSRAPRLPAGCRLNLERRSLQLTGPLGGAGFLYHSLAGYLCPVPLDPQLELAPSCGPHPTTPRSAKVVVARDPQLRRG